MKVITEAILRDELRASKPETYVIPEGQILSPAAREYLQQLKIKIIKEKDKPLPKEKVEITATEVPESRKVQSSLRHRRNPNMWMTRQVLSIMRSRSI